VALTLKTVAGLGTAEIARAFLVSEPTISQRLLRTRRKIANAGIPYRVPPDELLAGRTSGVLAVLYLIFNAGYGQRDDHLAVRGPEGGGGRRPRRPGGWRLPRGRRALGRWR
jgi:RNA polymerase sigma-70 factor (ECF subfamily)